MIFPEFKQIYKAKHEIIKWGKVYNNKGEEFLFILDGSDIIIIGKDYLPIKLENFPWEEK